MYGHECVSTNHLHILRLLKRRVHMHRRHELAVFRAPREQEKAVRRKALLAILKGGDRGDRSDDNALMLRRDANKPRLCERLQRLLGELAELLVDCIGGCLTCAGS